MEIKNSLAMAFEDKYSVTEGHMLVIGAIRHVVHILIISPLYNTPGTFKIRSTGQRHLCRRSFSSETSFLLNIPVGMRLFIGS